MCAVIVYRRIVFFRCIAQKYININRKHLCTVRAKKRNVLLFPGQGSQYVGMTKTKANTPPVKQLFDTASDILGYDLLGKCLDGPKEELDKTMYCQPAVFVASLAALEKYRETQQER